MDRAARGFAQDGPAPAHLASRTLARERLRVRTLVRLRWLAVGGQLAALIVVSVLLDFRTPLLQCLGLVAASAMLNAILTVAAAPQRMAGRREATAHIAFDMLQLAGMLFLTGGVANPFALLLIAQATLGAATLPPRYAAGLGLLAMSAGVVLAFVYQPLPWMAGAPPDLPMLYRLGAAAAIALGIALSAAYAGYAMAESARMEVALYVAQSILSREQRLSALGGLAAAAAHELGTPLSTIALVAKELVREVPPGPLQEDAQLLVEQSQRCRDILLRLTQQPEAGDVVQAQLSLGQLIEEVIEPYSDMGVRVDWSVAGPPGEEPPQLRRMAEAVHALSAFVENAVDFAAAEVRVIGRFDDHAITIEVRDDGDGFSPEIFAKLGEPYVTSRPGAEGSRTGHQGMGLGFFVAKTLLERTSAQVDFSNARNGGAVVITRWPRAAIQAPPD